MGLLAHQLLCFSRVSKQLCDNFHNAKIYFRSCYYHSQFVAITLWVINPFLVNVPILYLLKTPENLWFFGFLVFSEVWNGNIGQEWVKLNVRLFGGNSLNHSVRLFETKNSRICQINSRKQSLNNLKYTISPKYFEVCLPQVWLGSFLNTLSHCWIKLV